MAEARPSVNSKSDGAEQINPGFPHKSKPTTSLFGVEAAGNSMSLSSPRLNAVEVETASDVLMADVRHINGFYTIADTLHKENANSAVTLTTHSQMGEVRMSSRVAEPSNYKHGHNHIHNNDWTKKVAPIDVEHLQVQAKSSVDMSGYNPLKELTECVEQITLLEDEDFSTKSDATDNLEIQQMPLAANENVLASKTPDSSLRADHPDKIHSEAQSVRKKDKSKLIDADQLSCGKTNSKEEIPTNISDFVLGYEKGHSQSHLSVRVPPDDSDLDRILPDGFDAPIELVPYESELQMPDIMRLITKDLSEPYSIYTYRYFIHNWPSLCFLAMYGSLCVGAIVCKLDVHKKIVRRGYIAMLAVDEKYRKHKIGSSLVRKAIRAMIRGECDEVVLETEITNKPALRLYENLGFSRDKRLFRYYLNGVDALRLKLWLR